MHRRDSALQTRETRRERENGEQTMSVISIRHQRRTESGTNFYRLIISIVRVVRRAYLRGVAQNTTQRSTMGTQE